MWLHLSWRQTCHRLVSFRKGFLASNREAATHLCKTSPAPQNLSPPFSTPTRGDRFAGTKSIKDDARPQEASSRHAWHKQDHTAQLPLVRRTVSCNRCSAHSLAQPHRQTIVVLLTLLVPFMTLISAAITSVSLPLPTHYPPTFKNEQHGKG